MVQEDRLVQSVNNANTNVEERQKKKKAFPGMPQGPQPKAALQGLPGGILQTVAGCQP